MDAAHAVMQAAEARASALANSDSERLADLLHERFRWTTHRGKTFNRQEYIRRNTGGDTAWRSQHLHDANVVVVGDIAVLYAEVTDVVVRRHAEGAMRMPVTQVWVRHTGTWTCLAGHAGPRLS
jgi:ketosteroid isomerase-like protein